MGPHAPRSRATPARTASHLPHSTSCVATAASPHGPVGPDHIAFDPRFSPTPPPAGRWRRQRPAPRARRRLHRRWRQRPPHQPRRARRPGLLPAVTRRSRPRNHQQDDGGDAEQHDRVLGGGATTPQGSWATTAVGGWATPPPLPTSRFRSRCTPPDRRGSRNGNLWHRCARRPRGSVWSSTCRVAARHAEAS